MNYAKEEIGVVETAPKCRSNHYALMRDAAYTYTYISPYTRLNDVKTEDAATHSS